SITKGRAQNGEFVTARADLSEGNLTPSHEITQHEPSTRAQHPCAFTDQRCLVAHQMRRLEGPRPVEFAVGEAIVSAVALLERHPANAQIGSALTGRLDTNAARGDADDLDPKLRSDRARRRARSTAHVEHTQRAAIMTGCGQIGTGDHA